MIRSQSSSTRIDLFKRGRPAFSTLKMEPTNTLLLRTHAAHVLFHLQSLCACRAIWGALRNSLIYLCGLEGGIQSWGLGTSSVDPKASPTAPARKATPPTLFGLQGGNFKTIRPCWCCQLSSDYKSLFHVIPAAHGEVLTIEMSIQLAHPRLGKVLGKSKHNVSQFLGIQYATLEHRLADATLPEHSASDELNATRYG